MASPGIPKSFSASNPSSTSDYIGHRLAPPSPLADDESTSEASDVASDDVSTAPLFDSPTGYTAGYSREPGPLTNILRPRRTFTTKSPVSPSSAETHLRKISRNAADLSLSKALTRSIIHLLPVLVSTILIVLSARRVYFSDLDGFPDQDIAFQAFQFAVKFHEILMTMSIGEIVLHRIRWDLLNAGGVPLGFLSAAYQLSEVGYLFSAEFWMSTWSPRGGAHGRRSWRRLSLSLLIVVACTLSLTVGPASGVVMIPRLKWWHLPNPFGNTHLRLFTSGSTQDFLWPTTLPSYGCNGWLCPSFGVGDVVRWAGALMWNDAAAEIAWTDGGDNFWRWVISNATDYGGWTVTTSPMMLMSTMIGSYWNWVDFQGLSPTVSLMQPRLSLAWTDGEQILRPLVQVQCEAFTSNETLTRDFVLPNDQLRAAQDGAYEAVIWSVPRNNTSLSTTDLLTYYFNLFWTRLPLDDYEEAPSAGLVFVMPDDNHTKTVVPCSVLAHWVPSDLSVFPKTDRNIHDTHSNPLDVINSSQVNLSPQTQIRFSEDWWTLLLADGDPTSVESVMHGITKGLCEGDCLDSFSGGPQGLAYRVSTLMGMLFTDAIARYVPSTDHVVVQNPGDGSEVLVQTLGDFENFSYRDESPPDRYSSWLGYFENHPDDWREVFVTVKRYGYGWSFDGLLVKFATLALLVQTLMALTHIAVTTAGRGTSQAWDSIGSMIMLALRSQRPAVPIDHGTGEERKETWAELVSVRVVEKDLELQVGLRRAETLRLLRAS